MLVLEIHFIRLKDLSISTKVLLLIILNLNTIALLTLIFFVLKSLIRLYLERRQRVLGSRFKTKIVLIFVILTSIPSILLFMGASGLLTNYIDRWFTPKIKEPLGNSISLAKGLYELEKERTLNIARLAASKGVVPEGYRVYRVNRPDESPSLAAEVFSGEEWVEVISGDEGDIIRAAVPVSKGGKVTEVFVVESMIPRDLNLRVNQLKDSYEDYIKLETFKKPLKLNYLLFLGFFTLLVIFTAIWVSLRIAKGITEPVQMLAQATRDVAAGNLVVSLKTERDDEIGLLIESFNKMVKDLNEGKEILQAAYLESDRRRLCMENILENIRSGVISLDGDGNIVTINRAALSILNLSPDAVKGKNYREILSTIKSDTLQELIHGIKLKTLERIERDLWATINGRRAMLRVTIMGLRDRDSNYLGLLVVFDDLTDIIKAQKAVAWQEVARRMAHEIKNPLTPIKLSTERMLRKWENHDHDFEEVFKKSTKTIIREVDGLKKLVDEFSRFGKMPDINKAPASISAIIEDVANLYRAYKGLNIKVSIPADTPLVELDGEQFKRVLINLFDNARQAMGEGGTIDVSVDYDLRLNRIFINVADNGPGIKEEDKDKLFLPYFSTKKGGTGLGLAIADRVITEHMGYLRVRDNIPKGTVFTIELPIKERL
jgi:two-component system nitrogen regulation sensor histidine kinase NtrY